MSKVLKSAVNFSFDVKCLTGSTILWQWIIISNYQAVYTVSGVKRWWTTVQRSGNSILNFAVIIYSMEYIYIRFYNILYKSYNISSNCCLPTNSKFVVNIYYNSQHSVITWI